MVDDAPCPGLGVKGPLRRGCSTTALLYTASKQAQSLRGHQKEMGKVLGFMLVPTNLSWSLLPQLHGSEHRSTRPSSLEAFWYLHGPAQGIQSELRQGFPSHILPQATIEILLESMD